jgi:hypothetical protein
MAYRGRALGLPDFALRLTVRLFPVSVCALVLPYGQPLFVSWLRLLSFLLLYAFA